MRLGREVRGATGEADGLVVWLHGLGASAMDFVPVVPMLGLPDVRFVFPQAPERPVTVNGGWVMPAWYDIRFLHAGPGREDTDQVRALSPVLWELVREEQEIAGVGDDRTVLAGFSQGGATALFLADRASAPLAGLMVLSAYELDGHTLPEEAGAGRAPTPALFCHGIQDPTVGIERGRSAYQTALAAGREAAWHEFPMGHEVHPQELLVIRQFLHQMLG